MDVGDGSGNGPLRPEARLGATLRRVRTERGMPLRALARKLFRSQSTLVEYERGHRLAPLDVVQAYETELGVVASCQAADSGVHPIAWQLADAMRSGFFEFSWHGADWEEVHRAA